MRAKKQAADWSMTPPPPEIPIDINGVLPDGTWGTIKTLMMKDGTDPRSGRPAENDLPDAISGELALLDTFARPVFGKRGYPKMFAEIVRNFLPSLDSPSDSLSEVLRVRIHKVCRAKPKYVSRLESGIHSALLSLKTAPLHSELA